MKQRCSFPSCETVRSLCCWNVQAAAAAMTLLAVFWQWPLSHPRLCYTLYWATRVCCTLSVYDANSSSLQSTLFVGQIDHTFAREWCLKGVLQIIFYTCWTFMLGILQFCRLGLPAAGLRLRLRFLSLFFSIFTKTLGFFFLAKIKRDAVMRVQFSVYIPWKTVTHVAFSSPSQNVPRHKIGLISSWGLKRAMNSVFAAHPIRHWHTCLGLSITTSSCTLKSHVATLAFCATAEPLRKSPCPPRPSKPCMEAISIIALAAQSPFSPPPQTPTPNSVFLSVSLRLSAPHCLHSFPQMGRQMKVCAR